MSVMAIDEFSIQNASETILKLELKPILAAESVA